MAIHIKDIINLLRVPFVGPLQHRSSATFEFAAEMPWYIGSAYSSSTKFNSTIDVSIIDIVVMLRNRKDFLKNSFCLATPILLHVKSLYINRLF